MALLIKDQIWARAQFRLSMRNTNKFRYQIQVKDIRHTLAGKSFLPPLVITLNPWCPSTKFSHYALNLNALRLHWCLRKEPFSLAKPRMKWTLFCSPKKRHPSPLTFSKMQYPSICRRSVNTPIINVFFCPISTILTQCGKRFPGVILIRQLLK